MAFEERFKVHNAKCVEQKAFDGRVSQPWLSCSRCLSVAASARVAGGHSRCSRSRRGPAGSIAPRRPGSGMLAHHFGGWSRYFLEFTKDDLKLCFRSLNSLRTRLWHRPLCSLQLSKQHKFRKPQIRCLGALLITVFHGIRRAF